jgi:hypothetical protein
MRLMRKSYGEVDVEALRPWYLDDIASTERESLAGARLCETVCAI